MHKIVFRSNKKVVATVSPAVHSDLEKTALLEKSTFQPPLNV
jgi:hypothetical protein